MNETAPEKGNAMDMQDFQDAGEKWRQAFGIDGTAGDAQDVQHKYVPAGPDGPCLVCGLNKVYRKHVGEL